MNLAVDVKHRDNGRNMNADPQDFERMWQEKLSRAIDAVAGGDVRAKVMDGSGPLPPDAPSRQVVEWSRRTMERMVSRIGENRAAEVMAQCACRYPHSELQIIRRRFEETGDVDPARRMLQDRFESFLRETLKLEEGMVGEIVGRGWGPAGVKRGRRIVATKIPKSENLAAYLGEKDAEKKRRYYCHCPRVRAAIELREKIPGVYCYCGAGYYKGIWEEIPQQPVRVEVLESVLQGGEECKVEILLPAGV